MKFSPFWSETAKPCALADFRCADQRVGSPAIASREERPRVLLQRPYTDEWKKETHCD
jgi:hypothetical protein